MKRMHILLLVFQDFYLFMQVLIIDNETRFDTFILDFLLLDRELFTLLLLAKVSRLIWLRLVSNTAATPFDCLFSFWYCSKFFPIAYALDISTFKANSLILSLRLKITPFHVVPCFECISAYVSSI